MNLIIDRGNTFVKWALFEGDTMRFKYRGRILTDEMLKEFAKLYPIENIILSSVRGINFSEKTLEAMGHYIRLDHHTHVPFVNEYQTPATLGRDRIAIVAGVMAEWPRRNALIIDTGTCITFDWITDKGVYLGGNISPGPELRYKTMNENTGALPLVDRSDAFRLIGTSTETALQNGGFGGCIAEIIGWIELGRERFADSIVVISGGDADSFATSIKNEIFVRPDLVLTGLNEIVKLNVNKK